MIRQILCAAIDLSASGVLAQAPLPRPKFDSFEVATVKPAVSEPNRGRYIKLEGNNRFVEKNYTLKLLIAAAYDLNPRSISGGPAWVDSDPYDMSQSRRGRQVLIMTSRCRCCEAC